MLEIIKQFAKYQNVKVDLAIVTKKSDDHHSVYIYSVNLDKLEEYIQTLNLSDTKYISKVSISFDIFDSEFGVLC